MADRVLLGKRNKSDGTVDYGLWVSDVAEDVTDQNISDSALLFDSSRRLTSLRVLQSGTFQIQCKKTFMGKKGALEIGSDEQLRANADYTKRYPFELDTVPEFAEYYASLPKNANVALYGFGEGEVPFTGNAFNQQYVQNVYCDYGTQTIEFNPPLPDHIKTPYISVFFAVGNSSGHFHPWYANVNCNDSQYDWSYANSQQCVHMDSAWFRGKWTFRERTIAPLGHDVNRKFPEQLETLEGDDFYRWGSGMGGYSTTSSDLQYRAAFNADSTVSGMKFYVGSGGSLKDPATVDPSFKFGASDIVEDDESRFSRLLSRYNEISFNVGDRDLHSPSSLWGGMLKSFAGLQGLTYFANSTHLKLDAFMTPTHSPTPFETEIVKERISHTPTGASEYDQYGNYLVNKNRKSSDPTGKVAGAYDTIKNKAFDDAFGESYKEALPRKFRTKYWDGSQTEYEWWPIGHANGAFTIAKLQTTGGDDIKDPGLSLASEYAQQENSLLVAEKKIPNKYQLGTIPDATTIPDAFGESDPVTYNFAEYPRTSVGGSPWFAVAHGDYTILREPGNDPRHEGTPFITTVNKGTRFPNQLPDTEAKGYPPNSQYEPGDAFLKTRTFQGQPTSLDSFWNSFSNNTSQWVSANTPYGEFYYADGGYAMDNSPYYNYGGADENKVYAAEKFEYSSGGTLRKYIKVIPSDWNIQRQSFAKHNWNGGNPKAGVGTEGKRFGFGGAGSAEALGGEGEGVFDTYYGRYIVYDLVGGALDDL